MSGAQPRHLAWLFALAFIVAGCTPSVAPDRSTGVTQVAGQGAPPNASAPATPSAAVEIPTPVTSPPEPPPPPPVPQPFAFNLYQEGDFVPQYTFDWCVAASIQMAHNLIDDTGGGSWTDPGHQGELWEMARARSSNSFNGANPLGWAQVLTESGGPYSVVSVAGYDDALRTAARAIVETGRPVGLVMWSGRHAWVMSGFESVGDPARFPDFTVTGVHVLDPLYPHGSGKWGPSPEPNTLLAPEDLAAQFVVREPRRWSSDLQAGYLLVLPAAH